MRVFGNEAKYEHEILRTERKRGPASAEPRFLSCSFLAAFIFIFSLFFLALFALPASSPVLTPELLLCYSCRQILKNRMEHVFRTNAQPAETRGSEIDGAGDLCYNVKDIQDH